MSDNPADSGDPNRSRDKTKDHHIYLEGNDVPVATVYLGMDHPLVVWAVRGPQDAKQALQIARGVIAALEGGQPATEPSRGNSQPSKPSAKTRPMSAALREHLTAGLSDDEVWVKIVEEYQCGNDKRYRIKEYRKELTAKGEIGSSSPPAPVLPAATMPFRLGD